MLRVIVGDTSLHETPLDKSQRGIFNLRGWPLLRSAQQIYASRHEQSYGA